jgi:hypothetical protein
VRKVIQYSQLLTAPDQNNFIPSSLVEWKEASVNSILGPFCVENFRFKMEFVSGGGNNLYIDNINISYENTTGIETINNAIVSIYPNPTKTQLTVHSSKLFSKVRIIDIMGKEVFTKSIDLTKNLIINTSNLDNGYYSIQLLQNNRTVSHSFLKTN